MQFVSAVQFVCGAILLADVGGEMHAELLDDTETTVGMLVHLALEAAATLALFVGFGLTWQQIRRLRATAQGETAKLTSLRGEFDGLLHQRFADWGLSKAEADIALLSLRGLKIAEIAATRHTRDGTIRAQLSTIFRKSGVSSRTELLALFMEEFLDHAANSATPGSQQVTTPPAG